MSLVYGGRRNGLDGFMMVRESADELTPVEPELIEQYRVRIEQASSQDDMVQIVQDMIDSNINVVSSDGYRVFSSESIQDSLTQLSTVETLKFSPGYYRYFNRTLNIRETVLRLWNPELYNTYLEQSN